MQRQGGGGSIGQSLQYIDLTAPERSGPAGGDVLVRDGLIIRPEIPVLKGGASIGQSLQYVDPTASERSGPAGGDVLVRDGLIIRPEIPVLKGGKTPKGGFVPSCMAGVVGAGAYLGPLAVLTAKRMMNRTKKGGGKENWDQRRSEAKQIYEKFCKPSATDVNKMAAALRGSQEDALTTLQNYEEKLLQKAHMEASKIIDKVQKKIAREAKKQTKKIKVQPTTFVFNKRTGKVRENIPLTQALLRRQSDEAIWATLLKEAERKLKERVGTKTKIKSIVTKDKVESFAKLLQTGRSTKRFLTQFDKTLSTPITKTQKAAKTVYQTLGIPLVTKKTRKVKISSKPEIVYNNVYTPPSVSISASSMLKPKTKRVVSQAQKNAYTQAKTNLASIKSKPHSSKIMKLVSLRKQGDQKKINDFLKSYRSVQ